jgi:hypothetical protein
VMLEPAGEDLPEFPESTADDRNEHGCGDCGSGGGGCGSGAGCGSTSGASHGGCSDCGIKKWVASRQMASR